MVYTQYMKGRILGPAMVLKSAGLGPSNQNVPSFCFSGLRGPLLGWNHQCSSFLGHRPKVSQPVTRSKLGIVPKATTSKRPGSV